MVRNYLKRLINGNQNALVLCCAHLVSSNHYLNLITDLSGLDCIKTSKVGLTLKMDFEREGLACVVIAI